MNMPHNGVTIPPTSFDDDWSKMAVFVTSELARLGRDASEREVRLTAKIDRLTEKLDQVALQGAATHAKVVLYGAIGGGLVLALAQAFQKFIVGG